MGLQLVIQANSNTELTKSLGSLIEFVELFPVTGSLWGLSVPTKVLDSISEETIESSLAKFNVYYLYSGEWRYA